VDITALSDEQNSAESPYSASFFEDIAHGSSDSARAVVGRLTQLVTARSVADFGCGTGAWLAAFKESGTREVIGIESASIPEDLLMIDSAEFLQWDLTQELDLGRRFDLVLCLETAEHLPHSAAPVLVKSLTLHADLIAFSAAVPGQTGTQHLNEQPLSYWLDHFSSYGYRAFDLVRPAIWNDGQVEWWYRQNLVLLARGPLADRLPRTQRPLDAIHPMLFDWQRNTALKLANQVEELRTRLEESETARTQLERDLSMAARQVANLLNSHKASGHA
jgi:SAM-dependent methyltransferase